MKKIIFYLFIIPQIGIAQSDTIFNHKQEIIIIHQKKINDLLNKYKTLLKETGGIQGWKVQVKFTDKREDIISYQAKFEKLFPNIITEIIFDSPYYKLTCGNFRSKNDALKLKEKISPSFPGAHHISSIISLD
tara:strand:+ start:1852 stop:2250 length:399 start_codon:yes stop_codon:yes gene_type:complete